MSMPLDVVLDAQSLPIAEHQALSLVRRQHKKLASDLEALRTKFDINNRETTYEAVRKPEEDMQ